MSSIIVVLDEPQDLVNIAGVVRAMMNMGLSRLRLVNPAEWDPWRITGIAHRSDPVVDAARHFTSLDEAVADCVFVIGTSARPRTAQRNYGWVRDWAPRMLEQAHHGPVAMVFGREDRGLSNEALDRCDGVAMVPTDPGYSSLNLAQAVLVFAYELFLARQTDPEPLPTGKRYEGPASREELEEMFDALKQGLESIDFFKARSPESVMRAFRTLLSRTAPDRQEAGLVRAVGYETRNVITRLQERTGRTDSADPAGPDEG